MIVSPGLVWSPSAVIELPDLMAGMCWTASH